MIDNMNDEIKKLKADLETISAWFLGEVSTLRTGRATPALVEDIEVDQYGTKTPIKHIASISTPDPKTIIIQPWDKSILEAIAKAIETSPLHLSPIAEKDAVRLTLPALTEERRKDLVKILSSKSEEARVKSRQRRDDSWKMAQDLEKDKKISEDEKFRAKDELQKCMDDFNAKLDDMRERKEKEIMEV